MLSIDEVLQHFGDSGLVARGVAMGANAPGANATQGLHTNRIHDRYNNARIAIDLGGSASRWWLRSPGFDPRRASFVNDEGSLILGGYRVFWSGGVDVGIRPALWLYL